MTTDNKRVAAYLPKELYDHLQEYKAEHDLTESKVIINSLAAFFGVSHEVSQKVAHQFVMVEQFADLQVQVAHLSESLSKLQNQSKPKPKSKLKGVSQGELIPVPVTQSSSGSSGELSSELQPMKAADLSARFGLAKKAVTNARGRYRNNPDKFTEWLKSKDPDSKGWEYREDTKLYHLL